MKRKSLSLIAIVLTVCFTVSSFPLQALSLGTLSATDSVSDSESSDIFVVEEDITKRGEYEKHFLCSDGTYRAVTYAVARPLLRFLYQHVAGQRRCPYAEC